MHINATKNHVHSNAYTMEVYGARHWNKPSNKHYLEYIATILTQHCIYAIIVIELLSNFAEMEKHCFSLPN